MDGPRGMRSKEGVGGVEDLDGTPGTEDIPDEQEPDALLGTDPMSDKGDLRGIGGMARTDGTERPDAYCELCRIRCSNCMPKAGIFYGDGQNFPFFAPSVTANTGSKSNRVNIRRDPRSRTEAKRRAATTEPRTPIDGPRGTTVYCAMNAISVLYSGLK